MEEPKITSGTVPYIASEIPDDPRDITPEQWEAMKAVDEHAFSSTWKIEHTVGRFYEPEL